MPFPAATFVIALDANCESSTMPALAIIDTTLCFELPEFC